MLPAMVTSQNGFVIFPFSTTIPLHSKEKYGNGADTCKHTFQPCYNQTISHLLAEFFHRKGIAGNALEHNVCDSGADCCLYIRLKSVTAALAVCFARTLAVVQSRFKFSCMDQVFFADWCALVIKVTMYSACAN